ncbi:DsbC family protein [Methylonatrum kenyense]|uniref:DsbC family protein n=1 Tax=Methylonatrum kenyense TaxID=455253 RepID=UPI0020BFE7CF|nr:DsbC family protein [Methylonatrum kenyense]MCK8516457.1 DsbC family protein [Methylonatrum kenyense]
MTYRLFAAVSLAVLVTAAPGLLADDELAEVSERISERLQDINPELRPDRVDRSPVPDLYQVVIGGQVLYITGDGRYLVQGDMMDLETRRSVSDDLRGQVRLEQLDAHGVDNMIVYPANGDTEHVVTVFTDIDCPYCRQFHANMDAYNDQGIEVRYVQMPRAGLGSDSHRKATAVWCADDRRAAMDEAKDRGDFSGDTDCDNPVEEQLALAQDLGVNSTPSIITERGILHRGLVPADELRQILDEEKARAGD